MIKAVIPSILIALGAWAVLPGQVHASDADLTVKLQEAITKLTPEQQSGLLQLLSSMAPATPAPQSAEDALHEALAAFGKLGEDGKADLAPFYARISEDFNHWAVGGKSGAVNWLESMSSGLFRDGKPLIEFNLSRTEIEEDGDSATAYPIEVFTPLGGASLEITAKREADGVWRMVGVDGL